MRRRIAAAAASVAMIDAPAAHGAMSTTDPVSYKPYETRYLELRQPAVQDAAAASVPYDAWPSC